MKWGGLSRVRSHFTGPLLAVALLVLVTAGGTVGYVVVEGWSWWDAFYMKATSPAEIPSAAMISSSVSSLSAEPCRTIGMRS